MNALSDLTHKAIGDAYVSSSEIENEKVRNKMESNVVKIAHQARAAEQFYDLSEDQINSTEDKARLGQSGIEEVLMALEREEKFHGRRDEIASDISDLCGEFLYPEKIEANNGGKRTYDVTPPGGLENEKYEAFETYWSDIMEIDEEIEFYEDQDLLSEELRKVKRIRNRANFAYKESSEALEELSL